MGNKVDRAWDKTKAKTREMKEGVKVTFKGNSRPSADVRSAQQALRDKGHNPGPIDGVMGPRTSGGGQRLPEEGKPDGDRPARRRDRAKLMAAPA